MTENDKASSRPTVAERSSPAAIAVDHLVKVYKQTRAVDDISFSLPRGSITGLLGGNGAGKTTTIAMIMGLVLPTAGRVQVLEEGLRREAAEGVAGNGRAEARRGLSRHPDLSGVHKGHLLR